MTDDCQMESDLHLHRKRMTEVTGCFAPLFYYSKIINYSHEIDGC